MIGNKTIFLLLLGIIIIAWIASAIAQGIERQQGEAVGERIHQPPYLA